MATDSKGEKGDKITVLLLQRQAAYLDVVSVLIRLKHQRAIPRAEIIRALVEAMAKSEIDFTQFASGQAIGERLEEYFSDIPIADSCRRPYWKPLLGRHYTRQSIFVRPVKALSKSITRPNQVHEWKSKGSFVLQIPPKHAIEAGLKHRADLVHSHLAAAAHVFLTSLRSSEDRYDIFWEALVAHITPQPSERCNEEHFQELLEQSAQLADAFFDLLACDRGLHAVVTQLLGQCVARLSAATSWHLTVPTFREYRECVDGIRNSVPFDLCLERRMHIATCALCAAAVVIPRDVQ